MGWNSWNTFGSDISDGLIREMVDAIVSSGLSDTGYKYVVIDDCWSKLKRDKQGRLVPDEKKFPHGMKSLSDYVHSKGLKFGMYSCSGSRTCAGYPGSYEHEFIDAHTFADWGVDFLKYDYCYKPERANGELLYRRMGMALKATGRNILFSACNWGQENSETWMRVAGADMFRSTGDIVDNYESIKNIAFSQVDKLCYSGSGCFNDMDMLVVGMYGKGNVGLGGCNDAEYKTHFALWCLFNSPLMIGCDIRTLTKESKELLMNKALISINQDTECRPPFLLNSAALVSSTEKHYSFARQLSGNKYAFGFFNMDDKEAEVCGLLSDVGLTYDSGYAFEMTDVFTNEPAGIFREFCNPKVGAHDCKVYIGKLVKI
jgi:alpha-galactosidase